jgi:ubiquinone/menaquinone biosynthesis C-methylase UbiE
MSVPAEFKDSAKQAAIDQWSADPCGPETESEPGTRPYFEELLNGRSKYAPWMADVLDYDGSRGLDVLDVGCGQGIDVARYASAGARTTGIDLTPRHVELTNAHLGAMSLEAEVLRADAESLPFSAGSFDRLSSNGVLHHTPDMPAALREAHRVLRRGGEARIIVYNRRSLHYWVEQVGRQGLLERQLFQEGSMEGVLSRGVEVSTVGARPLVRVYSPRALRRLMSGAGFSDVSTSVRHFSTGDTFITQAIARRSTVLDRPALLDRVGRLLGWYVVGFGRRADPLA